ncbi:MAG: 50S ribosomal protein L17 [Candidatus Omnitrophica bacterium]|nr:50S ribosomal protein L17 [Candidatus Omnitrophota bacterium]MDD5436545.1 50S ribosomal protein L17 [Candidatus Omnitrophota bacterium]
MRHRKKHSKLGMKTSHRKAALRNIAKSLLKYQRITISIARAKEVRRLAEHLITLGKTDTVTSRRHAFDILTDRDLVGKLFKETAPLFKDRASGYTRIIPMGYRRGDGAEMCVLELTERKIVEKLPKKKKGKESAKPAPEAAHEEKARAEAPQGEKHKEVKKQEPKIKTISKSKPTLEDEKRAEKARSEDKKLSDKKGFMKNLRGLFRKRGDF